MNNFDDFFNVNSGEYKFAVYLIFFTNFSIGVLKYFKIIDFGLSAVE